MKQLLFLFLLFSISTSHAQNSNIGSVYFSIREHVRPDIQPNNNSGYNIVSVPGTRVVSSQQLPNGVEKTLIFLIDGQSNMTAVAPSAYVPTNATKMHNFNIYDATSYSVVDPLLGQGYNSTFGVGSIGSRIADTFITNGIFDRVYLVTFAIGGTDSFIHSAGGALYDRPCAAMSQLKSRGITPGMTNVTFGYLWGQGESDNGATSQSTYQARVSQVFSRLKNCGGITNQFNGRIFVNKETMLANVIDANIQAAQIALVDNITIFAGGNIDSLTTGTNRQADGTHLNDTGMANAATLIYNAMHATGAPF